MLQVALGIDIGGTNTDFAFVDRQGHFLAEESISTVGFPEPDVYVATLMDKIKLVKEQFSEPLEVVGIGIGAPMGNINKGTIEYPADLPWKGIIPLADLVSKHTSLPILVTNDANAAAVGEMVYGNAKGMKNFVVYTLGTGVGSGIVVNGDLVYGSDGFAGECGHTTIVMDGRLCGCGGHGHLEAYCSAPGMKRTAVELLSKYNAVNSPLATKNYNELDSKMIFEAAEKGDPVALEVFELTGNWLGMGLANTVHHLSPEAIFLFGGPTAAGSYIFRPTIDSMEKHLLPIFKNKVKILPSQLKSGDAAIVGASALVYKELDKKIG